MNWGRWMLVFDGHSSRVVVSLNGSFGFSLVACLLVWPTSMPETLRVVGLSAGETNTAMSNPRACPCQSACVLLPSAVRVLIATAFFISNRMAAGTTKYQDSVL